jgi:hypothetical protein
MLVRAGRVDVQWMVMQVQTATVTSAKKTALFFKVDGSLAPNERRTQLSLVAATLVNQVERSFADEKMDCGAAFDDGRRSHCECS